MLEPIGEQQGLPGDPLYWHTNIQGELEYESDAIINELLARFEASPSRVCSSRAISPRAATAGA